LVREIRQGLRDPLEHAFVPLEYEPDEDAQVEVFQPHCGFKAEFRAPGKGNEKGGVRGLSSSPGTSARRSPCSTGSRAGPHPGDERREYRLKSARAAMSSNAKPRRGIFNSES